jgi:leader peptidase (prepilin peptidase)/N-methyltransferase
MNVFIAIFLFIFGAVVGSFLNVVIDRLPQKRSIWKGRSVCDSCHKKLGPFELIPVISYIALSGKCSSCHARIPVRLTLVEILTGLLFVFSYFFFPASAINLIFALTVVSLNIAIFFIDLDYGIIPDELVAIFVTVTLLFLILFSPQELAIHLAAGIGAFLLFLFLFLFTRGKGLGFGDVKLVFAMGLFLGFPGIIIGFYFAFLTGAVFSVMLILYGKKGLKSAVPFGPFLTSGTLFAYFFGGTIISLARLYTGW